MQNKPNFRKSQMNVIPYNTTDYENISNWTLGQSKPNSNPIQTQSNPIAERVKLMQSEYLQRIMKKNADKGYEKTNPIQTQSNPTFFHLIHLAHTPQANIETPIIDPITNIHPEMNLKKLKKPQFSLKFPRRVSEMKCPFTRYVSRQNLPGLS